MPNKNKSTPKPQYHQRAPRSAAPKSDEGGPNPLSSISHLPTPDLPHAKPLEPRHFELRDDGTISDVAQVSKPAVSPISKSADRATSSASPDWTPATQPIETPALQVPNLIFSHESPFLRLYHGDCFQLLDAIAAKYPQGRFDAIFADPPYFLSNGGITCHAGRMVKVDKGDWDKSRGPELNHEFNREWLARCQRVLKPNGTIWVSGTHHVIFSIGYAMQQLGFKILNDIAWEKPNPPPNLSCRYFTHSTETILWAARDEKSKHVFNYDAMRAITGKQMKTVWRDFGAAGNYSHPHPRRHPQTEESREGREGHEGELHLPSSTLHSPSSSGNIWTLSAPASDEKVHGKHPTQKPIALIERCLLASTNPGDLVLDPFLGGGTTAIAALKLNRGCVGIEADFTHITLAVRRADHEIISIWLRHYRVSIQISVGTLRCGVTARTAGGIHQIDLDLFANSINGSLVDDKPQPQLQMPTERIFHETKFVFLSCAEVERGSVVHTTVDVSLQEAWAKTPTGKKRETTHIVRCETEILRVKSS